MANKKSFNVFKRNTSLLEFLKSRKGEENIASASDIHKWLNDNGYSIKLSSINMLVKSLMYEYNAPICYTDTKGYYWAKNRSEIEKTILDLESRRTALDDHIKHLKNFIID